ncbi:MAG: ABC transporter permease [Bacteroidales bacterium]|nr:ABC transporter permease [Bacteroidales bacterium]
MNTELFIARKIVPSSRKNKSLSGPVITFSIFAISLGIMIMILSLAIVHGFKKNIKEKIFGFGAHIQIVNFDSNTSLETIPINTDSSLVERIKNAEGVDHIQTYSIKPGIVKTNDKVQGVVLKGVDSLYRWNFFEKHLLEGSIPNYSDSANQNKILLSKSLANLLELKCNDQLIISFIPQKSSESIRYRKFQISGIYETNLEDFDKLFIFCNRLHINKLNTWTDDMISGYEVLIKDNNKLESTAQAVWEEVGYGFLKDGSKLKVETIEENNPQIFDWLSLLDMNVIVLLTIIIVVSGLNMVSGLLVIILEKTNMIGIMKAIGAKDISIRKVFLYVGILLIGKGLLYGNILGITLCLIQHYTQIIPLDAQSYFMSYVPIDLRISDILLLNIGSLLATFIMLLLPSLIISKIEPVKALKFN